MNLLPSAAAVPTMKKGHALVLTLALALIVALGFLLRRGSSSQRGEPEVGPRAENAALAAPEDAPVVRSSAPEAPEPVDGRVAKAPTGAPGLHARLESPYTPMVPLSMRALRLEDQSVVGAPRETVDGASWSDLAPGRYRAEVWGEGWTVGAAEVELPDAQASAEVALRPSPLYWVAGGVTARATGQPLEAFQILVEFALRDETSALEIWPGRTLRLRSADGRFALAGVPQRAEQLRLTVTAPGYLTYTTDWLPAPAWHDDVAIRLDEDAAALSVVRGRVVQAGSSEPGAGARLILVGPDLTLAFVRVFDGEAQIQSAHDVTGEVAVGGARGEVDVQGGFRLTSRYEGLVRLLVVPREQRVLLSEPFELRHGLEHDLGTLWLDAGGTIEGRVWEGEPGAGLSVTSVSVRRDGGAWTTIALPEDKSFRIGGLEPGNYRVSARARIQGPNGSEGSSIVATTSVRLAGLETEHVDLHCGAGLVGRSVSGRVELLEALREYRVMVLDVDLSPVSMTLAADDGSFTLHDLPEGTYTLVVAARNPAMTRFAATWRPLSVPETGSLSISLAHSTLALHSDGGAGKEVSLSGESGNPLFDQVVKQALHGVLDEAGDLVVWGLPEGLFRFETAHAEQTFAIPAAGGATRLEF